MQKAGRSVAHLSPALINWISDLLFYFTQKKNSTHTRSPTSLSRKHHTLIPHKITAQNTRSTGKKIETHNTVADLPFSIFRLFSVVGRTRNRFVFVVVCCVIAAADDDERAPRQFHTRTQIHTQSRSTANCQNLIATLSPSIQLSHGVRCFFSVAVVFASTNIIVVLLLTHCCCCFCFCCSSAEFSSVHRAYFFSYAFFFRAASGQNLACCGFLTTTTMMMIGGDCVAKLPHRPH